MPNEKKGLPRPELAAKRQTATSATMGLRISSTHSKGEVHGHCVRWNQSRQERVCSAQPRYSELASPRLGALFVLRCTQKLRDRLNSSPDPEPAPSDTVLGDWYANLIRVGRIQVVLGVSERSLLPIVVPARDGRSLVERLSDALEPMLTAIGVPVDDAIDERGAMQRWAIGKTLNRRILGSLNDLAFQLQVGLLDFPDRTLQAQSIWLARTPLKVIDYGAPDQATLAAFAARRALRASSIR